MSLKLLVLAFSVLAVELAFGQNDCGDVGKSDSLQMTITLFRHGDRTPQDTYPTDPYQVDHWMKWGGWGHLTQVGMEQQFNFGRWVRKCYGPILTDTYIPNQIYVRSTDFDRTLMSGLSHIAGLFAPKDFQIWSTEAELAKYWQPIPIHTIARPDEYLLNPNMACPPLKAAINDAYENDPMIRKIQTENQAMLDYMAENAGLKVPGDFREVEGALSDTIYIERLKGLQLPPWINSTVEDLLMSWMHVWVHIHSSSDEILRLAMGDYVYNLQQMFQNKTKGLVSYKHVIYSAHDSTVSGLLRTYDPNSPMIVPPYASGLITELHKDPISGRYYVKAFFRNDTSFPPFPTSIRNCRSPCWLEDFVKELEPFSLSNKKEACYSTSPGPTTPVLTTTPQKKDDGKLSEDAIIAICVCVTFTGTVLLSMFFFLCLLPKLKGRR